MMIKSVVRAVVLVGTVVVSGMFGGGCATVVSGTHKNVKFESTPPGATVQLSGGKIIGKTPCQSRINKKDGKLAVSFSLDGYHPQGEAIYDGMELSYYGNALWALTGVGLITAMPIGFVVDMQNGAYIKLKSSVHVSLDPIDSNTPTSVQPLAHLDSPLTPVQRVQTQAPLVNTVKSNSERLAELNKLKEQGVLTQEEYDAKRQKIIEEI